MIFINTVAFFLAVSLYFYCLFAGADFGAGMLELFLTKERRNEQREIIAHAIAPVWEANHVWIVLAVVILFNGFPKAYSEILTTFHIPILFMLLGIILRGCAFTFARYDAVKDKSQYFYSALFIASSFMTPLFLGVVAGGLIQAPALATPSTFVSDFISPWFNPFCFSLGVFACCLFSFLAAIYLIGETRDVDLRKQFSKYAFIANILTVVAGAVVFFTAEISGLRLFEKFVEHKMALGCVIVATLTLAPLWVGLRKFQVWTPRILAAAQVFLILVGWFVLQFPVLMARADQSYTIYTTAAPQVVLIPLLWALFIGIALIFPALLYLLKIFKGHVT